MDLEKIMADLEKKNPGQPEFLQAVKEVLETIEDVIKENPKYDANNIIERIIEPDRVISFKVEWLDDKGNVNVNRGYRVQFNNAIGPYKGGLRFHPSVTLGGLKFLGFEQTFKNALTTLPMGGAKGGSDFNPKGKSNAEIMRFCQSFMAELYRYIGPDTDIPAGDIGVGGREIGFLYGMYKKLVNTHNGVMTGKGRNWGGSLIRPEATGFGNVYFAEEMLKTRGESLKGKIVAVSGFGNVSWGSIIKANQLGARVVTISGPDGYVYDPDGISGEKIDYLLELRASNQDIVKPYTYEFPNAQFFEGKRPWEVKCDVALPCAIQNELNAQDAQNLVNNGVICVSEGANMPCTPEAMEIFLNAKILYAPGKASNAGGVATSGLEQTQNAMKLNWTAKEVEDKLHQIMVNIHEACVKYGKEENGFVNYVKGANVAGFIKVADAMIDQGVI
ncbi:MAG: NADP-specific glutamate dehydrogenase [Bacteroides sp.]|jgi:glutamate dehydrogenase (NADP+)|nr:NADP-specific glutamate dehydrogenase [Bacteroides sp.]